MLRPASLAQQNALRLIVVFVAFEIIAALAVVWFLMMPLAWRSADDFAGLLTLSAETWGELPPMPRPAFERHLAEVHGIELQVVPPPDAREREGRDLYVRRVEETLRAEFGDAIRIAGAERAAVWSGMTTGTLSVEISSTAMTSSIAALRRHGKSSGLALTAPSGRT